jgi:hypothetical protein
MPVCENRTSLVRYKKTKGSEAYRNASDLQLDPDQGKEFCGGSGIPYDPATGSV